MICARPSCNKVVDRLHSHHQYCSQACRQAVHRQEKAELDFARFQRATSLTENMVEFGELGETMPDKAKRIKALVDRAAPPGTAWFRFGRPKDDEKPGCLKWFPGNHGYVSRAEPNYPGLLLPQKAFYVVAYLGADFRLIVPWKYKICLEWCQPLVAAWYKGDAAPSHIR